VLREPSAVAAARKSAIAMRLARPTFTPRRRATYLSMGARKREQYFFEKKTKNFYLLEQCYGAVMLGFLNHTGVVDFITDGFTVPLAA